jgi:hypothetical protein
MIIPWPPAITATPSAAKPASTHIRLFMSCS